MKRLTQIEVQARGARVPQWTLTRGGLRRTFTFAGFAGAMRFVNAVAVLAEDAGHHPDIDIRWNRVTLTLTTHDAGGLTARDFALARGVDALPEVGTAG